MSGRLFLSDTRFAFECRPPPRNVPGVVDQTRGLLYYVEENCPGAFHAPHVKYVCIAGRYKPRLCDSRQSYQLLEACNPMANPEMFE